MSSGAFGMIVVLHSERAMHASLIWMAVHLEINERLKPFVTVGKEVSSVWTLVPFVLVVSDGLFVLRWHILGLK